MSWIRLPRRAPYALALTAAVLAVASFAPQVAAQARDGAGRAAAIFERFDKDKDGFVSQAEFDEARSQRRGGGGGGGKVSFADFDGNKDGKLSREEFNAGLMDVAERAREAMPTFEDYDADKNGKITEAEFNQARNEQQAKGGRGRGRVSFADIDTDKDGGITKPEFQKHLDEMRDKMRERRR